MDIEIHSSFKKSFENRISNNHKLALKTKERIDLFLKNPNDSILQSHALNGKKLKLKAFSVTGNIRIVYLPISKDKVLFLDIGTHNQVY